MAIMNDMEVTIKMIPLGLEEAENHRVIKMNCDKKEVEIGRASKNAHKGLSVAPDNAWFDYPILSRTHAKFTASPTQRTLYVQDCGSTHGTSLGKQKMDSGVEYLVNDGDIITFGTRVTSGAVTYLAKDFRVHSTWNSRIRASVARLFDSTPANRFEVPDDLNDSSSEPSREASIQILESHPRTFSVPSTDDESDCLDDDSEVEIASSVQENNGQDSAATTPDHGPIQKERILVNLEAEDSDDAKSPSKVRGLNLQGPSITNVLLKQPKIAGRSQLDPINLEDDVARKQDVLESESEDEGPEVLPIQQSPAKIADGLLGKEVKANCRSLHSPVIDDEETDIENEEQINHIVAETQDSNFKGKDTQAERYQSPESHLNSVAGATDGFDSADDDGLDRDDDFSDFDHDDDAVDTFSKLVNPSTGPVAPAMLKPQVTFEAKKPQTAPVYQFSNFKNQSTQARSTFRPGGFGVSMSDAVDVSQPSYLNFQPTSLQRASSPSDAALARPPPTGANVLNSYASIYPNAPVSYANPQGFAPEASGNAPYIFHHYPQPANQGYHSRPYNQGPFYNRSHPPSTFSDALYESSISYASDLDKAAAAPLRYAAAENVDDDAQFAAVLQAEEDAYAATVRAPARNVQSSTVGSESRKNTGEGQSSKINIASLVNDSHAENHRPLKRKVDEMSTGVSGEEDGDAPLGTKSIIIPAVQGHKTHASDETNVQQETQLPDAQARDDLHPAEGMSLTQESAPEAIVGSSPVPVTAKTVDAEEPARKRVKTAPTSSRGIGKFVSGVCVGLVGAFATFVATIPASVREEALRELSNAA